MKDGRDEDEGGLWEGLEGGIVWTGRKRKREGGVCYNGLSKSVGRYRWTRLDWIKNGWVTGKIGMVKCAWVCVCPSE